MCVSVCECVCVCVSSVYYTSCVFHWSNDIPVPMYDVLINSFINCVVLVV